MYLIWRMDTTAKGAKKNTSPNVIHLQYLYFRHLSAFDVVCRSFNVNDPFSKTSLKPLPKLGSMNWLRRRKITNIMTFP